MTKERKFLLIFIFAFQFIIIGICGILVLPKMAREIPGDFIPEKLFYDELSGLWVIKMHIENRNPEKTITFLACFESYEEARIFVNRLKWSKEARK